MGIDFDEYGYQKAAPGDTFRFDCSRCGECCRNVKDSIMVESLDMYRLARFLRLEMSEVATRYTDSAFLAWGFPVFMLKTKQHMDACVFLKSSQCSVYGVRPRACRTYPLGVEPDDDKPGEWLNFIVSKKPHHFTGRRRRVGDWVDENFTAEDRAFVAADYAYTSKIAKRMRSIDKRREDEVMKLILFYKYIAFDMAEVFLPQFTRNMERLVEAMERLIPHK